MPTDFVVLVLVVVTALVFDFTNGFHDTGNAMATSIATGALGPRTAVALSAFLNLIGAFLSVTVAATVAGGIVNLGAASGQELLVIVFAGLVGGILWNLTTWLVALPSSSSHALFGGLIGASLAALGTGGVEWDGVLGKIVAPALLSPIVAALVSAVGTRAVFRITATVPEQSTESGFRWAQIGSASLVSLAHGTNDAQKTMGVIFLALVAYGSVSPDDAMPTWVKIACALAIALGTYFGGWRVIRTLGKGLVDISARQGVAAESASAAIILTSSHLGLPLSTTHVATGSILGSGLGRSGAEVRWQVARRMALAWVVTLPAAAVVGAGCWALADLIGGAAGVAAVFAILVAMSTAMWFRSRRTPVGADNVNAAWTDTTELESAEPPPLPPVQEPPSSIEPRPLDLPGKDIRPVRFGRRTSRPVR
ncbi:inorganic phosphate transporter [Prescottella agglutinans]|uniref:Phosphate transporter n=1 Tax=Prescottella agglutinans TaxID=1644129 RepID=A0A3S3AHJ2_9NOCA|nr:inorganic phosphate transporter [Prescottella agglutinans]RVW10287.1 inorganic phosphate transporter [Prescottella agglutinans]